VDGGHMPTKVAGVLNPSLALRTIIRSLCRRKTSGCISSSVLRPCHVDRRSKYNETAAASVYIGIRLRNAESAHLQRTPAIIWREFLDAANSHYRPASRQYFLHCFCVGVPHLRRCKGWHRFCF